MRTLGRSPGSTKSPGAILDARSAAPKAGAAGRRGEAQGCAEQSLSQIDSIALMPRTGQKIAKKGYAFAE